MYGEVVVFFLIILIVWEFFFDWMEVDKENFNKSILVIGVVGGVGFIMV